MPRLDGEIASSSVPSEVGIQVKQRAAWNTKQAMEEDDLQEELRVRSSDGVEVAWPRAAVARSHLLANWLSDTGAADGAFQTPIPTAALAALARLAQQGDAEGGG